MNQLVSLEVLAAEINTLNDALEASMGQTLHLAAKLGEKLNQAKTTVNHGEWKGWLTNNCGKVSYRKSVKYMQLARELPELISNMPTSAHLKLETAIELLSASDEVKENVNERLNNGEYITNSEIRELKRQNELLKKQAETAVDDYKRENESLSDQLNLLEVQIEAYKQDEGLRLDDKLREINRKLKEEQEMANALREQRDRLNKENQDRIAVLEKALKAERDGLKSKIAEAKDEASKELKAKIDAEIQEREARLARLEAHLTDKRIELDQIEHRNSLIIDSEKTVQAINKNMMEISITLGDFMMSFDEYNGNKELPNLDAWERIFDNYQSGINVLSDLLRKFRSASVLESSI